MLALPYWRNCRLRVLPKMGPAMMQIRAMTHSPHYWTILLRDQEDSPFLNFIVFYLK